MNGLPIRCINMLFPVQISSFGHSFFFFFAYDGVLCFDAGTMVAFIPTSGF